MKRFSFGNPKLFAITIEKQLTTSSGIYGKIVFFVDNIKFGNFNQDCFINQVSDYLYKVPNANAFFEKYHLNPDNMLELFNHLFTNINIEKFPFISGLGEPFDDIKLAHFQYNESIYFLWEDYENSSSEVNPSINMKKISKSGYFEIIDQLNRNLNNN
jgi:hypothetical protein